MQTLVGGMLALVADGVRVSCGVSDYGRRGKEGSSLVEEVA